MFIVRVAAAALVVYVVIGARSLCADAVLTWSTCQAFYKLCVDCKINCLPSSAFDNFFLVANGAACR